MKSFLVINSKGGCGNTALSFLLANHFNLSSVSNVDPQMDFLKLQLFSASAIQVPNQQWVPQNSVYDLNATSERLGSLMTSVSEVAAHCITLPQELKRLVSNTLCR
jgi:hypothetical protein